MASIIGSTGICSCGWAVIRGNRAKVAGEPQPGADSEDEKGDGADKHGMKAGAEDEAGGVIWSREELIAREAAELANKWREDERSGG